MMGWVSFTNVKGEPTEKDVALANIWQTKSAY